MSMMFGGEREISSGSRRQRTKPLGGSFAFGAKGKGKAYGQANKKGAMAQGKGISPSSGFMQKFRARLGQQ